MLRRIALTLCLVLAPLAAHATFEDGLDAYDKQNYVSALQEFRKAAETGDSRAFGRLAGMYLYGLGTGKDYVQAYVWFDLAAQTGDIEAEKYRDTAAAELTVDQLRQAAKLAEDYYDKYVAPYKD